MSNEEVLSEETDSGLLKVHPDLQEEYDYFVRFIKTTQPKEFLEYTAENSIKVSKMDPAYVVTDHDTCDSPTYSMGYHDFGPEPRCCWVTHGWHILTNQWEDPEDIIRSGGYASCVECNASGDEEGDSDCEFCDGDGWANYYYD